MAADPRNFKAPFIDQQQCWIVAEKFRQQHWLSGVIPVDVESIAAFELNLEIRPITGLKEDADVDALLLGDWRTLIVDQQQYMDERFINRLRFSIAHELGHFMLHKPVFDSIPRSSAEDWITFMQEMPDKEYRLLEYHANEFAGRLLVPFDALKAAFEQIKAAFTASTACSMGLALMMVGVVRSTGSGGGVGSSAGTGPGASTLLDGLAAR